MSGWAALSQRFGALPFADLFEPAIRYARDGYLVSPVVAEKWALAATVLPHDLGFAEHFLPRGRAPRAGEKFACEPMATSLEAIASTHGNAFYRGELAQAMAAHAHAHGALHAVADFASHSIDWVDPLALDYGARDRPRDPAERPGHRRADGTGHPARVRPRRAAARLGRRASTSRSRR